MDKNDNNPYFVSKSFQDENEKNRKEKEEIKKNISILEPKKDKKTINEAVTFIDNAGNLKTKTAEEYNKDMHQYNTKMSIINQDEIIDSLFEDVLKEGIETTKTPSRKIPGPVYVAGRKLYIKISREEGKQMADAAFKKFFRGDTDDLDDVFNKIKIIRQTGIDPSTGKTVKVRNQKEVNKTKGIREEKDFAILSKEKEIENLDKKIDNLEVRNEKKVDYLKQQKSNKEEEKNSLKTIKEADDGTPTENIQILTILLNNIRGDIQDELTAIKGYDEHAEKAEKFGLKNVAELNRSIRDEEKVHIGELQALLNKFDKEFEKSIDDGEKEANETLKEEEIKEINLIEILNDIRSDIHGELTAIKNYDAHAEQAKNAGYEEIEKVVKSIRDEEKVHIGELQALLNKFDKEFEKSIDDGEKEAEDVLKEGKLPENIKEREYGIEEEKKFPLFDKDHVLSAIKFFNYVKPEFEKHLAKEIILRMKKYNITSENVGIENRLKKYL